MKTSKPINLPDTWTCHPCGELYAGTVATCRKCGRAKTPGTGQKTGIARILGSFPELPDPDSIKTPGKGKKPKEPNATEARWPEMNPGKWIFEGLSFRISGGKRYTCDFYQPPIYEGAHSVKGAIVECKPAGRRMKNGKIWRERSYERSRLAFLDAQERYPEYVFKWVEWDGRKWVEK